MAPRKSTAKKTVAKKSAPKADPMRETIEVSHGPNVDGLAHQVAVAHGHSPATDAEAHRASAVTEAPATSGGDAGKEV